MWTGARIASTGHDHASSGHGSAFGRAFAAAAAGALFASCGASTAQVRRFCSCALASYRDFCDVDETATCDGD
jgi:hypothetical protein